MEQQYRQLTDYSWQTFCDHQMDTKHITSYNLHTVRFNMHFPASEHFHIHYGMNGRVAELLADFFR